MVGLMGEVYIMEVKKRDTYFDLVKAVAILWWCLDMLHQLQDAIQ